jgi:Mg/Co/Ni transporter MgtE
LANHLDVTLFLTMLVGAGGNASNQAAVAVIRMSFAFSLHPD